MLLQLGPTTIGLNVKLLNLIAITSQFLSPILATQSHKIPHSKIQNKRLIAMQVRIASHCLSSWRSAQLFPRWAKSQLVALYPTRAQCEALVEDGVQCESLNTQPERQFFSLALCR